MIAGIGDPPRLETKPADDVKDRIEIDLFFCFGVRVVVAEIAVSFVKLSESKIDGDSFRVSDVEVACVCFISLNTLTNAESLLTIWLGREPRVHKPACSLHVLLTQMRVYLRVPANRVQCSKEAFLEHARRRDRPRTRGSLSLLPIRLGCRCSPRALALSFLSFVVILLCPERSCECGF